MSFANIVEKKYPQPVFALAEDMCRCGLTPALTVEIIGLTSSRYRANGVVINLSEANLHCGILAMSIATTRHYEVATTCAACEGKELLIAPRIACAINHSCTSCSWVVIDG